MESVASNTPSDKVASSTTQSPKDAMGGSFSCSFCPLQERFDYKGAKPPFARQILYSEECYIMKDPFSLPNRGEVLVLGSDCSVCKKPVCLGCSIYFGARFCSNCASDNMHNFPLQLHSKIKSLIKSTES